MPNYFNTCKCWNDLDSKRDANSELRWNIRKGWDLEQEKKGGGFSPGSDLALFAYAKNSEQIPTNENKFDMHV